MQVELLLCLNLSTYVEMYVKHVTDNLGTRWKGVAICSRFDSLSTALNALRGPEQRSGLGSDQTDIVSAGNRTIFQPFYWLTYR